jgi:hypothetical protein
MHGASKSMIHIPLIDLTKDEDIKQEPTPDNQCASTFQYTFRILIENEVSLCNIKINKRCFFFKLVFIEKY